MAKAQGKRRTTSEGVRIAGKNPNGAGSVYMAGDRYRATYIDPSTGKKRTVSGRTKTQAVERRDLKLAELTTVSPSGRLGEDPSLDAVAYWWLENVAAPTVRPTTLHRYGKDVARIVHYLGTVPAARINIETVRSFLTDLQATGLGVSTIRDTRTRLRQIAACAVELGYLVANPVPMVPTPKATAKERRQKRVLTIEEVHRLLSALDGARPFDAAIGILFTSGCRVSETLGLAWEDVDLDAGTARIRRGCTYTGGGIGVTLDLPKTTSTSGVLHLAPTAVALLRARKAQQAADRLAAGPAWEMTIYEGKPLSPIFTSLSGRLVQRQKVTEALNAACERAGIDPEGIGTHTGRRSVITSLYVAGVPLDDVAHLVGHASPTTTADYVQDLGDRPQATARRAAELLDPAVTS